MRASLSEYDRHVDRNAGEIGNGIVAVTESSATGNDVEEAAQGGARPIAAVLQLTWL